MPSNHPDATSDLCDGSVVCLWFVCCLFVKYLFVLKQNAEPHTRQLYLGNSDHSILNIVIFDKMRY